MRPMRRSFGITVAELLVALAVVGVLTGFAIPAFHGFIERNRATIAMNQLLGALQSARAAAVTLRSIVVVCPGGSAVVCGARDSWHLGMLIFSDRNGDGRRDPDEQVLRWLPGLADGGRIYWRSFRNRSYLQFNPSGLTNWQNGNLLYCPPSGDVHFAREVIINPAARPRKAPDRNHDGIPEDANGQPVRCP
jgi:type IV fimbrial biogenesis protein FimT